MNDAVRTVQRRVNPPRLASKNILPPPKTLCAYSPGSHHAGSSVDLAAGGWTRIAILIVPRSVRLRRVDLPSSATFHVPRSTPRLAGCPYRRGRVLPAERREAHPPESIGRVPSWCCPELCSAACRTSIFSVRRVSAARQVWRGRVGGGRGQVDAASRRRVLRPELSASVVAFRSLLDRCCSVLSVVFVRLSVLSPADRGVARPGNQCGSTLGCCTPLCDTPQAPPTQLTQS